MLRIGRRGRALAVGVALAVLAMSVAASPERAAKYFDDATARARNGDVAGAVVQLKNALQQDPKMLAAHTMLATLLLEQGDAAGAETTFEQALRLGVARSEIIVPLAQATLELGKPDKVIKNFGTDGLAPGQKVQLLVIRGHAYRALADPAAAARSYEEARSLDNRHPAALLSLADLLLQQRSRADSLKLINEAIALLPADPRPWEFRGRLALADGDMKGALDAFGKSIAVDPKYIEARVARATALVELGELDQAAQDLAVLLRLSPLEPRANYVRALHSARRGDDKGVREALQQIVDATDRVPRDVLRQRTPELLMLGGLAYYGLGQNQKARVYLEDYLAVRPREIGPRKVLASILLAQGWPREAIDVLEPARKIAPKDPDLLVLLASAHMARRRYELANGYLEDALRSSGGAGHVHTALGLSHLGGGNQALAVEHLERALKKDPGQSRAGLMLAVIELRRGRAKAAVALAEAVAKREPSNPVAHNLLGAARTAAGDRDGARHAYEKAVQVSPGFYAARLNLARLESASGDYAAARTRLQGMLKQRPNSRDILFELALVEEGAGRTDEAIRLLEKARGTNRRNVATGLRLVDIYLRLRQTDKALEVAREVETAAPENLEALAALSRAYLAAGNEKLAQATLGRMARIAAFDAAWQARIAEAQLATGNAAAAVQSLERALSAQPDFFPAQALMAQVELHRGEVAKADQRARALVKRNPENPGAYRLLGDVALAAKNYPEAIEAYRRALAKEETTDAAIRLYRAFIAAGSLASGNEFLETWLRARPVDPAGQRALAEGYLRAGDLAAARTRYEALVAGGGSEPVLLNNLANILLRQRDPKAIEYAERAHKLAPQDPTIGDTLGWVLVQNGQVDAGLRYLRDARLRDPNNGEVRYHLAVALALAGRRDEARRELEQAFKGGASFDGIGEARKLLAELGGRQ